MGGIEANSGFGLADSDQLKSQIVKRLEEFRDEILEHKNDNTRKAYVSDFALYKRFCEEAGYPTLSSDISTGIKSLKNYVRHLAENGYKKGSIKRKLSSISYFIDVAEIYNPIKSSKLFKEFVKTIINSKKYRTTTKQAPAFKLEKLNEFNQIEVKTIIEIRNSAIINLAFDTMLRASNIIDLEYSDLYGQEDNVVFVRFSKTDQSGEGSYHYISDFTKEACDRWVKAAGIKSGKLFRSVKKNGKVREYGLSYHGLLKIIKCIGKKVGIDITCHSSRVGAAVSMFENDISELEIMRHGHWKSTAMVSRYTKKSKLKISGIAELRDNKNA